MANMKLDPTTKLAATILTRTTIYFVGKGIQRVKIARANRKAGIYVLKPKHYSNID